MTQLPTNLAAEYPAGGDPSIRLHHHHHDIIHAAVNEFLPAVVRTTEEWAASTTVLRSGQLGIASDTGELRPGDGVRPWSSLPTPGRDRADEAPLLVNLREQPDVVGDGVADDAEAINKAAAAAAAAGLRLVATGTFRINSTVTLTGDTDLSGATFKYHGSGVAVQLGGPTVTFRRTLGLPTLIAAAKGRSGWVAGTVGVRAVNLNTCFLAFPRIAGFETGLSMFGAGGGTAYCTVQVGHLDNNKRNLVLGADASGWSNQNTFIGGRYSHNSAEGENVPGSRHILLEDTANPVNNNTWVNPSVEGNTVEQQIDVDGGCYNLWITPRLERSLGSRIRWGAAASHNLVQGGVQAAGATVTRAAGESRNSIQAADRFELFGTSKTSVTRLRNTWSDSAAALAVYGASSPDPADYRWRWSANKLEAKRVAEDHPRVVLDGANGRLHLGTGTAAAGCHLAAAGTDALAVHGGHLQFGTDNTFDIGGPGRRPRDVRVARDVTVGGALTVAGRVGFYGKPATAKPVVKGSRGGNAALGSLIQALAQLGLVTDQTTR